jgi:hypothetical protein
MLRVACYVLRVVTEYRIPNTDYRVAGYVLRVTCCVLSPNTEYRILITEYRLRVAGCGLRVSGRRMPHTAYRLPITDYRSPITVPYALIIIGMSSISRSEVSFSASAGRKSPARVGSASSICTSCDERLARISRRKTDLKPISISSPS